jgi:hypothetical protein
MAAINPALGGEVLEVDPGRGRRLPCHGINVVRGNVAGEGFDHDVGGLCVAPWFDPVPDFDRAGGMVRRELGQW